MPETVLPIDPSLTLRSAFAAQAGTRGECPALWIPDQQRFLNWADLFAWAGQLGNLIRREQAVGDPSDFWVAHSVRNSVDDVIVALACQLEQWVEIPIDVTGGNAYVQQCREKTSALWIDEDHKRELVQRAWQRTVVEKGPRPELLAREGDVNRDALVLWTSGTSGNPKGVVLSQRSLSGNAAAKLAAVPQQQSDVRLTVLSIAHAYARTCDLGTWLLSGCRLALGRGFDDWQCWAKELEPTHCNTVPSLAERMLREDCVPASLSCLGCGGAALTDDAFSEWLHRGVAVIQGYGLTEAGPVVASQTPRDSMPQRVGRVVAGWQTRLDGARLFVRGPHVMTRYLGDPTATAERIDAEGWLDTGDLIDLDARSGQLRILGRADDRIVLSNGFVVDPHGVELQLVALDGIRTAVVTPSDEGRGVDWWLETDPGVSLPPLQTVTDRLANWEKPRQIRCFSIPQASRGGLFNRKGAIRRKAMQRFLCG